MIISYWLHTISARMSCGRVFKASTAELKPGKTERQSLTRNERVD